MAGCPTACLRARSGRVYGAEAAGEITSARAQSWIRLGHEDDTVMVTKRVNKALAAALGLLTLGWEASHAFAAEQWPRFRGPNGTGVAEAPQLPSVWTEGQYLWKVRVPGEGHSSPIVWNEYLFLTSAGEDGRQRMVLAFDATTGHLRWQRSFELPPGPKHERNSHATPTPATDGQRVYASFGSSTGSLLVALDYRGEVVWTRSLPPFVGPHGAGASPICVDDLVIVSHHDDGESFVLACDAQSGQIRWRTPRLGGKDCSSYSTPFVWTPRGGSPQLVCLSRRHGLFALDPASGRELWSTGPLEQRTVASPVGAGGLLVFTCGSGSQGQYLAAADPSLGKGGAVPVRWRLTRQIPYVPTPLYYRGLLFLWTDLGVVSCVDLQTGQAKWVRRVTDSDGRAATYWSSPIGLNGCLYCVSVRGEVAVIRASEKFEVVGYCSLGEAAYATPAVADGRLYWRGVEHLFCVGPRQATRRSVAAP
jgi:outer membrane protein assembly factor BamB